MFLGQSINSPKYKQGMVAQPGCTLYGYIGYKMKNKIEVILSLGLQGIVGWSIPSHGHIVPDGPSITCTLLQEGEDTDTESFIIYSHKGRVYELTYVADCYPEEEGGGIVGCGAGQYHNHFLSVEHHKRHRDPNFKVTGRPNQFFGLSNPVRYPRHNNDRIALHRVSANYRKAAIVLVKAGYSCEQVASMLPFCKRTGGGRRPVGRY